MNREEWRGVVGYEGKYQVSDRGNVRSMNYNRKGICKNLKAAPTRGGYLAVCLSEDANSETRKVHQLEAESFLDHVPCGYKLVIEHKDRNRKNNNLTNLEIITQRQNSNKKHLKSSSEFVGVSWIKKSKKWQSTISIKGKNVNLGRFKNEKDASDAYQDRLKLILEGEK